MSRIILILAAIPLIFIPSIWLGFDQVTSVKTNQASERLWQLDSLARLVSDSASAHPKELLSRVPVVKKLDPWRDLYAYALPERPSIDGRDDDWNLTDIPRLSYGEGQVQVITLPYTVDNLNFDLFLGQYDGRLYGFVRVRDDRLTFREIGNLSVHRNDHIQIAMVSPGGRYQRFTLAVQQPGEIESYEISGKEEGSRALRSDKAIEGYWLATETGYQVEFSIPLARIGTRFGISVGDVDDNRDREIGVVIGTSGTRYQDELGTLVVPQSELTGWLDAASLVNHTIWLLDAHGRVIAQQSATSQPVYPHTERYSLLRILDRLLAPVAETLVPVAEAAAGSKRGSKRGSEGGSEGGFQEGAGGQTRSALLSSELLLSGQTGPDSVSTRRSSEWQDVPIYGVASPVFNERVLIAWILVEQSGLDIQVMANRIMSHSLTLGLLAWLVCSGLILVHGLLTSRRIHWLYGAIEARMQSSAVSSEQVAEAPAKDEMGRLGQRVVAMVEQLQQYNSYLEALSGRLAHELRTPVTVVRSSLDNLALSLGNSSNAGDVQTYLGRAYEGVGSLSTILSNMTEASRLEQSLDQQDFVSFDLNELIRGCVHGYQIAWPDQHILFIGETEKLAMQGAPELLNQMLDKLVNNAVEFANPGTDVRVRLTVEGDEAVIRVMNEGPELPAEMSDRLFESMVSLRGPGRKQSGSSHLGLGLYIARTVTQFHGGTIRLANREETPGVIVTVRLPRRHLVARHG